MTVAPEASSDQVVRSLTPLVSVTIARSRRPRGICSCSKFSAGE
jgi:hypothetical protein